ncbi:MAG TPA: hypothetical protein EYP14_10450, partial [Planctomycetaceae bacterium]|nr:hypothetical protein [Planctomycetaceae bacterium]
MSGTKLEKLLREYRACCNYAKELSERVRQRERAAVTAYQQIISAPEGPPPTYVVSVDVGTAAEDRALSRCLADIAMLRDKIRAVRRESVLARLDRAQRAAVSDPPRPAAARS